MTLKKTFVPCTTVHNILYFYTIRNIIHTESPKLKIPNKCANANVICWFVLFLNHCHLSLISKFK